MKLATKVYEEAAKNRQAEENVEEKDEADTEWGEAAYVYNIFLGDQYVNVSTRGTVDNPTPDELLEELFKEYLKDE